MVQATGIDWAEQWRRLYEARAAQQQRVRGNQGDFWGRRAEIFSRRIGSADAALDLLLDRLKRSDTLLDVGGGAGRYAIPAAAHAREVVVVEPSLGMVRELTGEMEKRHVHNIRLIESDWLSADAPMAEVVFCAHVLYFTPDALRFVQKLDAQATRECIVVLRVDQAGAGLEPLYQEIFAEPRAPEPSFIDFYNLLHQIGIVANVQVVDGNNSQSLFTDLDQAEVTVTTSLGPPDDAARAKIRPFLEAHLERRPDGMLGFRGTATRVAFVSWSKSAA
jgi:hypothetical protein